MMKFLEKLGIMDFIAPKKDECVVPGDAGFGDASSAAASSAPAAAGGFAFKRQLTPDERAAREAELANEKALRDAELERKAVIAAEEEQKRGKGQPTRTSIMQHVEAPPSVSPTTHINR